MENLERGKLYEIVWVDGEEATECVFDRKHRGFLIFVDQYENKIICRPESLHSVILSQINDLFDK
tara:strand:+ start:235 stop:429 length:195 start_codon:yes stop_codon:yes gene_type:complete